MEGVKFDFAKDGRLQTRTYFRKSELAREINIFNGKKTKRIPAIGNTSIPSYHRQTLH